MSLADQDLVLGTTRLFAARTAAGREAIRSDKFGLLESSDQFFDYDQLLNYTCSLVLAPPWIGKSYVAKRIHGKLAAKGEPRYESLTALESYSRGDPFLPGWWDEWKKDRSIAVWIVDALDEGQQRDPSLCPKLLECLDHLALDQLDRLRLLILARDGDLRAVAPGFESDLLERLHDRLFIAELLPLDADNARSLIGPI